MFKRMGIFCCFLLLIFASQVYAVEESADLKNVLKQIHLVEDFQGEILTKIYIDDTILTYQTGILKDGPRADVSTQHTFWQLKGTEEGLKLRAIPWFYLPPDFSLVQYALPIQRKSSLIEPLQRIEDDYEIKLIDEKNGETIFELNNGFIIQNITYDKNKNVITKIQIFNTSGRVMSTIIYANWKEYSAGILLPETIQVFGEKDKKLMEMVYLNWKINQGVDGFASTLPDYWNNKVKDLKDKILDKPDQDELHFKLAQLYEEQQFWDNALEELDKAFTLNSKVEYREEMAQIYEKLGKYQEAILQIQAVLEERERGENYFFLGNLYTSLNNPMLAQESYEYAVKLEEDNINYWERLFWNYRNASRDDERMLKKAIQAGEKLVQIGSRRYQYRIYLGDLYVQDEDYNKALEQYLVAQEMEPDESLPFVKLARYYEESNKYDEALVVLLNAVKVQENWWNYLQLGDFYLRHGQMENTLIAYEQSLQMNPRNTDLSIKMGRVLWQLGEKETAKSYWYQALQYEESNVYTYIKVGKMLLEYNLVEDAEEIFKQAVERFQLLGDRSLTPGLSRIYEEMGLMYLTKDYYLAIDFFEKAYSNKPSSIVGQYLGLNELKEGNLDKAIRYWEEANLLDGDNVKSYLYLTVVKGLKGEMSSKFDHELKQVKEILNVEEQKIMGKFFGYFPEIHSLKLEEENTPLEAEKAFNEGMDAFMAGNLNKAVVNFKKAVNLDRYFKKGNFYLGITLSLKDESSEAQTYFKAIQNHYAGSNIARVSIDLDQLIQKIFWKTKVFE